MRASLLLAALLLAACAPTTTGGAWRPQPIEDATEPSDAIKGAAAADWRAIDPQNLLIMELGDGGRVAIELAPDFAPIHVANIRALARDGWWTGSAAYRVQDNYVVQWGVNESTKPLPTGVIKAPPAEYTRPLAGLEVRPLGYPDSYAAEVGHAGGWPVALDRARGFAWLTHCYGFVGVGRDLSPDTGTGGELYAVIGHAPRHLDRNIAVVGRVIDGFETLTARPRGTEALGFYKERSSDVLIARIRLAADIPSAERPSYEVLRTDSAAFAAYVAGRANRGGSFFDVPAGGVDLCNAPVPTRRRP